MGGAASGRLKIFDETNCLLEGLSETSFTTTVHHQCDVCSSNCRQPRQTKCVLLQQAFTNHSCLDRGTFD